MQLASRAELPRAWITKLLARLRAMYGEKFSKQWEGIDPEEILQVWSEELAGYSGDELAAGLAACRGREWPPTLPEFMRLCRPWMAADVAFMDAVNGLAARRRGERGSWRHPAIYWAAVAVGTGDMLANGYSALRSRWERALAEQFARAEWEPVPEPAAALPAPGQTLATREDSEAAMRRMGAGGLLTKPKRDPRRWASRILAEHKRKGGRRFTQAVVAMAERALAETPNPEGT